MLKNLLIGSSFLNQNGYTNQYSLDSFLYPIQEVDRYEDILVHMKRKEYAGCYKVHVSSFSVELVSGQFSVNLLLYKIYYYFTGAIWRCKRWMCYILERKAVSFFCVSQYYFNILSKSICFVTSFAGSVYLRKKASTLAVLGFVIMLLNSLFLRYEFI